MTFVSQNSALMKLEATPGGPAVRSQRQPFVQERGLAPPRRLILSTLQDLPLQKKGDKAGEGNALVDRDVSDFTQHIGGQRESDILMFYSSHLVLHGFSVARVL